MTTNSMSALGGTNAVNAPLASGQARRLDVDWALTMWPLVAALGVAITLFAGPRLFGSIFVLDLWCLGYQHVVATFSRIGFDLKDVRDNRRLVVDTPVFIFVLTATVSLHAGSWLVATTYFYWQFFHYTRQAFGISKYFAATEAVAASVVSQGSFALYAVAVATFAWRLSQGPDRLLGMPVWSVPVPATAALACLAVAALAVVNWAVATKRSGLQHTRYSYFLLSALCVLGIGYVAMRNMNESWLVVNVWHNLQYIIFVWKSNIKRFRDGEDKNHPMLSYICQPRRAWLYVATMLGISSLLYGQVALLDGALRRNGIALTIAFYMTLNFHHYVVDGLIWKRRRKTTVPIAVQAVPHAG